MPAIKKTTRARSRKETAPDADAITPAPEPDPADSAAYAEGRHNLLYFTEHFFKNFCRHPFSDFHRYLFGRRAAKIQAPLAERQGVLDVVLAPRGAAKSTLVSLVFPIHALLYRLEGYIVLISATQRQANQRLSAVRGVLLQNEEIKRVFAPQLEGLTRLSANSIELGGVRIDAFGAMGELRGIANGPWRPTWIILDDVERSDRVRRAEHRDRLAEWFSETVDHLGERVTNIDLVGTLLHRDALPARLARRPDAAAKSFRAVIADAANTALWEEWRAIFHDRSNDARERDAHAFFESRKAAMLEGAEVLWPERESYYELQKQRETAGRAAFDKEKQNQPWADGAAVFASFPLRRFRLRGGHLVCDPSATDDGGAPEVALEDLRVYGFLDPALGGDGGDFASIATVGVDPTGYTYLLDVWLAHAGPSEQVQRIFDLHAIWDYQAFGLETNAFQKLLLDPINAERGRRRNAHRPWDLAIVPERHRQEKVTRILALEPVARNGWLLFNEELPEEFMNQLLDFPGARHDDGPDAVAAAVRMARLSAEPPLESARRPRRTQGAMSNF